MCTHKAQKYDFCTHQAHFSLIWAIWEPPMALIAKMVEKSIKICQIFFSRKYIIKRVRKRSFIKNVPKLAILTLSLQDMKNSLWRKMGQPVANSPAILLFGAKSGTNAFKSTTWEGSRRLKSMIRTK